MKPNIHKHFDYLTPFEEAENDRELEKIMRLKCPKACSNLEVDAAFFARMVDDVRKFKAWRVIGCASFEEFCESELGKTLVEVDSIVFGVKMLLARGAKEVTRDDAMVAYGNQYTDKVEGYNVTLSSERGNNQTYIARRLARDCPALLEKVQSGELSARAAGIEAGFVKPTIQIVVNDDAQAVRQIKKHFTAAAIRKIKEGL